MLWRSSDVAALAKRFAGLAGIDPATAGGKSFRIKSATDLLASLPYEEARLLLHNRGRWWSDIEEIYARITAGKQLAASAALGQDVGATLEGLGLGYVQPSR